MTNRDPGEAQTCYELWKQLSLNLKVNEFNSVYLQILISGDSITTSNCNGQPTLLGLLSALTWK